MSNVIVFPDKTDRHWLKLESRILELVRKAGLQDLVAAEISTNLRPLFDLLYDPSAAITFTFSASCAGEFEAQQHLILNFIEERNQALLRERIQREIQACKDSGVL